MVTNAPPYDLPLFNTQYVFFKSLLSESNPSLKAYGQHAANQIHSIASLATGSGLDYINETESKYYHMWSYIQFVESMAKQEREAETSFINQQIILLKQNNELELAQELESYLSISSKDPQLFLLTINKLFQESKEFEDNVTTALTRIESISNNMQQLDKEGKQKVIDAFEQSYRKYTTILMEEFAKLPSTVQDNQYRQVKNINSTLAKKVNAVIRSITSNETFINAIEALYATKTTISSQDLKKIIINIIIQQVTDDSNNTKTTRELAKQVKEIVENLADSASSRAETLATEHINAFNSNNTAKEIEIAAFNNNESLANIILSLDDESIGRIKEHYPKTISLIDSLKDAIEKSKPQNEIIAKKAKLTEVLRKLIKAEAEKKIGALKQGMNKTEYLNKLREIDNFITPVSLSTKLNSQLQIMSVSHDDIAEITTTEDARKQIKNVIISETPGKLIQLKADVRFAVGYIDSNAELVDGSSIQNIINETIQLFYKDFMKDYKSIGQGSTDVDAAAAAYMKQLLNMKNHIDKFVKDHNLPDESRYQLYNALYETFSNSISVKDYELYNNDLGVHGGALGPGKIPEGVINNVTKMYQMGGITAIDAKKILFAVLNCGDAMVGSDIKTHLETYLLGGAALLMFDDGFANSEEYLNRLVQELDGFRGQKLVHIYRVSTMYIPASFILDKIAKNLKEMYFDILTDSIKPTIQHNRVTIINNITEESIPKAEDMPKPIDRWTNVSNTAQSQIKITFSFMGGLLEILKNFKQAVSNAV